MKNPLIEKYGSQKRWVNYRIVQMGGKKTKIPYSPITGGKASSTDVATWSDYKVAKAKSDNVGIVFTAEKTLLGIDIDHCLKDNKIVHEQKENIEKLIKEAATYTEISPSGEGLHLYIELDEGLSLESNKSAPFEVYTSGRYFTVTGNVYNKQSKSKIRTVTVDDAKNILAIIGYPWHKEEVVPVSTPLSTTGSLSDNEVLQKMFASKNGSKIRSLYDGNGDSDQSKADMSLCSHLTFWTGRDHGQIERLWMSSPLGSRKKTQKREDYRNRTISHAIAACKEVYTPHVAKVYTVDEEDEDIDLLFFLTAKKDKEYYLNTENICRVLRKHKDFKGRFRYDIFRNTMEILVNEKWRTIESNDSVVIQTQISILFPCFAKVGKDMVFDAIIKVSKECEMDSALDFLTGLTWDKIPRLDQWLCYTYGVPDDVYFQAVGSNWFKGMVKRAIEPGCKFDYVLVLEGPQGSRKSTSLAVLGGAWHLETAMSTESKDFFMQMLGKLIVEFSEGETLNKTEVKRMKAIITTQSDKYRPPYERVSQEFPRRCVFAMTTNQDEYLKDETGNRRWLPVKLVLPEANIEWLEQNREQLYAEAYHRVKNLKESIHEFPKEETKAMQELRRIRDPNADLIYDWYFGKLSDAQRADGITVHQVYRDAIHGGFTPSKPLDKYNEMNIADTLRTLLGLEGKRMMKDGERSVRWTRKLIESPLALEPVAKVEKEETSDEMYNDIINGWDNKK